MDNKVAYFLMLVRALLWFFCSPDKSKLAKVQNTYKLGGMKLCWRKAAEKFATGKKDRTFITTGQFSKALDLYVNKEPKNQNILDIFTNEWSSAMPDDRGLATKPGKARLFDDDRIKWAEKIFGGFQNLSILELGPLEGGHSYMLQKMGAKKITCIEANTRAFLKCLCIKEIFDLNRVEFKLGDFISFLKKTDAIFDLVIASGVLYHMMNPIELLELMSQVTDRIFIWTHYYDKEIITASKNLSHKFAPLEAFGYRGNIYMAAEHSYKDALNWLGFCGGAKPKSKWLCRDSIINCLQKFGFSRITIGFDDPSHPNGPAFAICAKR